MSNVLILGAAGKIARLATQLFLDRTDDKLTLYLRRANRLTATDEQREKLIDGDTIDEAKLTAAVKGQDVVYANLAGANIEAQAKSVVKAMDAANIKRLIWISTLGIYDEVPGKFGQWNHQMLDGGYLETYAAAAKVIEASDLDYTIVRPAWLTNTDEIDYELTQKGEPFKGTEVSRKSIADLVVKLTQDPTQEVHHSIGVNKANTDGAKPAWY
ncbi:SDR family oxidoreductase [Loigolactobacillus backii]|uniref:NAD-dependent dehydratase n=1 Tax=Loigolactobacillus backii TaxID=375175 RepID=A0A192H1M0_9LACO|nr:SDR family oxidoreductase [Loigolactobacillus backii]ANK60387.1 NAD-dependent dehydratase [Loigolactobacillus backii]ANK62173.1 NAD-dependent dehydratase [Loigolactobacillus backii]ANK65267.1 NAD-dependent dehydratase [Loigolactobacillus backii]ANK67825.1 NAD-dependent dehydratase [Loigolactobacillus backii]ANK70812.1 NAD-dependent dehydratase [Loigolactobacillus backii]